MKRRLAGFAFAKDVMGRIDFNRDLFVTLLLSLPKDTVLRGVGHSVLNNLDIIFFESNSFKEVLPQMEVPLFHPVFERLPNGTIILLNNGIEKLINE